MTQDPVELAMLQARVKLLLDQPFFGQIILHLEMEEASSWCPTAATDGKKFYYNREFVKSLDLDELLFLHGHETLHVILEHIYRRGDRDRLIWGIAIDYITNYILVKSNVGKRPSHALYNDRYTDECSAEELYDRLKDTLKIKTVAPYDVHLDVMRHGDADGTHHDGLPFDGPTPLTSGEIQDVRDAMQAALLQASQHTPAGKMPAGVQRLLDKLVAPKLNWRQILTSVIRSTIKYDYTYTRLSRRSWSSGFILPGQNVRDRIELVCAIDASGSTTRKMVSDFLSEIAGILLSFRQFSVTVLSFDINVYNVEVFTPDNAGDINRYQFKGGGGTRPSCCWEYLMTNRMKPDKLLIFTDGEVGNDWGNELYVDTIFIIHSNPEIKAPYGQTISYEN
jgi:predicted metal-dependent peptidase